MLENTRVDHGGGGEKKAGEDAQDWVKVDLHLAETRVHDHLTYVSLNTFGAQLDLTYNLEVG